MNYFTGESHSLISLLIRTCQVFILQPSHSLNYTIRPFGRLLIDENSPLAVALLVRRLVHVIQTQ